MRKNIYSVGQVNTYIQNMFAQDFMLHQISIKGEVSNCKYHSSGHIYFTLKDQTGTIAAVMFSRYRRGLAFQMKEGDKVVVTGSVEVYERDGKYQLYAREIELEGAGNLYLKFEALKREHEEMGMFDAAYKKPIPRYATRIGIVTAPTGAAIQDIRNIAANLPSTKTPATAGDSEGEGSDGTTQVLKDLRSVLVPTTSEILWGVINGDILQTVWNKVTSSTGSLVSIGVKQLAKVVGEPYGTILNYVGGGATYVCYVNGQLTSYTTSIKYPVLAGGLAVRQEVNGSVKAMIQLMPMKIDKVGAASVLSGSTRYEVADNAQVYLWYKGQYYATKLAEVNSDDYYLTGWYDNFGCAAGKRVRVIVAVKKD